jgi:hypothetical protein
MRSPSAHILRAAKMMAKGPMSHSTNKAAAYSGETENVVQARKIFFAVFVTLGLSNH